MKKLLFLLPGVLFAVGCASAPQHRAAVTDDSADRVSVGVVQREIRLGMPGSAVVAALGSPNLVTTNEERNEVWVYDKLATDVVRSEGSVGAWGVLIGPIGSAGGAAIGTAQQSASATSTSQRTLTIVIRFDANQRVSDFAYHASRF